MALHLKLRRYPRWPAMLVCVFLQGCITFSPSASHEISFNHTGWKLYAKDGNRQMIFTPDGKIVTDRYIGYTAYLGTDSDPIGGSSIIHYGINEYNCQSLKTQTISLNDGSLDMTQGMCHSDTFVHINFFVKSEFQSNPLTTLFNNLTLTDSWDTYNKEHNQQKNQNDSLVTFVSYTRTFTSTEKYPHYKLEYAGLASATNKEEIKSLLINAKLTPLNR